MFKILEVTTSTSSYTYLVTKIRVNPPRHIFFFHLFTLPLHPSFFLLKLAGGLFQKKKKLAGGLLMVSLPRCKHHHLSITGESHVRNSHCNMVTGLHWDTGFLVGASDILDPSIIVKYSVSALANLPQHKEKKIFQATV
jgi:hypothetical protein